MVCRPNDYQYVSGKLSFFRKDHHSFCDLRRALRDYARLKYDATAEQDGATKLHHVEGTAKAAELKLSEEELSYLEELYIPHKLVGVMAQNTQDTAKESHVWSAGNQKI